MGSTGSAFERPVPHITPLYEEWTADQVADLIDRSLPNTRTHSLARCRWCGSEFVYIFPFDPQPIHVRQAMQTPGHWICRSVECAQRQLRWAIPDERDTREESASPWVYVPTPACAEVQESGTKNVLIGGAAGGSKSHGLRWNGYWWCKKIAGYTSLLIRQSFPELEKTHLMRMDRFDQYLLKGAKYVDKTKSMQIGDSAIVGGHCYTPKAVEDMLSQEWDEIDIDEASLLNRKTLTRVCARARADAMRPGVRERGGGWCRLATNPGGPGALYLEEFYITRNPDKRRHHKYHPEHYAFIGATVEDNPYLEEDYVESRLDPLDPNRFEQLRHGKWGTFSGQFFSAFKTVSHVVSGNQGW